MVTKKFEVTLLTPLLFEEEREYLAGIAKEHKLEIAASKLERILVIEGDAETDIHKVIKFLAETGFAMDVGLIKEVTEYEPDIGYNEDDDDLDILFTPE